MSRVKGLAIASACLTLLGTTMPGDAGNDPRSDEADIRAENTRWAEAYAREDFAALGALYTPDGMLLPPGAGRVVGRAAISAFFARRSDPNAPKRVRFGDRELYGSGDTVTEVSNVVIEDAGGRAVFSGKQTLLFVRDKGVWKLHRDMWNADAP